MSVTAQRILAALLPISAYLLCLGLAAEASARDVPRVQTSVSEPAAHHSAVATSRS